MRRWLVPLTLVALVGIASPPAAASSIVYVKGGDIWRYSVTGARKRVIVRAPGITAFSAVTQDDRGRLWAVREPARRWERYSPAGRRLGKPFDTPAPKYFVAQLNAPNVTDCCHNADITASLDTSGLAWPSWLHDGTFIAAPFSNLLKGFGVWYVPARVPELRYWFGGHLPGPPPAAPDRDCTWANPHGTVAGLTWSPDGTTLAWSDSVGVWTARFAVPAQTGQGCVVTAKRLLARGATSPDWSPA